MWKALKILEDKNIIDGIRIGDCFVIPLHEFIDIARRIEHREKYGDEPMAT